MRRIMLIILLFGVLLPSAATHAAERTVTRTDDPFPDGCEVNGCSLREAVIAANTNVGPDTIKLGADTFTLSIVDPSGSENAAQTGDLDLTSAITITGAGINQTIVRAGSNLATSTGEVFQILGGTVTMSDLGIFFGKGDVDDCGGGVLATSGSLTLDRVQLGGNSAKSGSAICNFGSLRMFDSIVSQNDTSDTGAIRNFGDAVIETSWLWGNDALYGAALTNSGSMLVRDSTLDNNNAISSGGAIWNRQTLTMINSTLSGNRANNSGGAISADKDALTRLYNTTVAGNFADDELNGIGTGGGVMQASGGTGVFRLINSILAGNQESTQRGINGDWVRFDSDCGGAVQSDGYALIETRLAARCTVSGAFVDADPLLGALGTNGGPTMTHLPGAGSPAIDAGDPAGCRDDAQALTVDQRGIARPQGSRCDLGAVEVEQAAPSAPASPTPSAPASPTPTTAPSPAPASNRILLPLAQR